MAGTSKSVTEGKATIWQHGNEVFYNPVQETNRDLSIIVIKLFQELRQKEKEQGLRHARVRGDEGIRVLEALSASGLRSIRYAKEIDGLQEIVANDFDEAAVEAIRSNIVRNDVAPGKITVSHNDAAVLMYLNRSPGKQFDVVDIDPYGTAAPFLDAAVQAVVDGGLLCVTCTDLAVLCGSHPEVCMSNYGGMSLKGKFCHEMALRLLLNAIERAANRYKRHIVPLVNMHIDFYIRCFVRVMASPAGVKNSISKTAVVYNCTNCTSFYLQPQGRIQPIYEKHKMARKAAKKSASAAAVDADATVPAEEESEPSKAPLQEEERKVIGQKHGPAIGPPCGPNCDVCGSHFHVGGPIWSDALYDTEFVTRALAHVETNSSLYGSQERLKARLTALLDEDPHEVLFHDFSAMTQIMKINSFSPILFKSALQSLGFTTSISHTYPLAIKTNAPSTIVWDVMRHWYKDNPATLTPSPNSPAAKILAKEPSIPPVNFEIPPPAKEKKPRFLKNPAPMWGPATRATGKRTATRPDEEAAKKAKISDPQEE